MDEDVPLNEQVVNVDCASSAWETGEVSEADYQQEACAACGQDFSNVDFHHVNSNVQAIRNRFGGEVRYVCKKGLKFDRDCTQPFLDGHPQTLLSEEVDYPIEVSLCVQFQELPGSAKNGLSAEPDKEIAPGRGEYNVYATIAWLRDKQARNLLDGVNIENEDALASIQ